MKLLKGAFAGIFLSLVFVGAAFSSEEPKALIAAGPGNPAKLTLLQCWVNPDPNDRFHTEHQFDTTDDLKVIMTMTTSSDKKTLWQARIKNQAKTVVWSDEFTQPSPGPGVVFYWDPSVGNLAPGFYLVEVRIKQGKKKVGSKWWIKVN